MPYFALIYDTVDDYVERRAAFRGEHLAAANDLVERGELLLGGAFANPVDRALLVFNVPDAAVVEAFARSDPYVVNELVRHWEVREWNVVIGSAFNR
jgi:uncharacterized protein YciI